MANDSNNTNNLQDFEPESVNISFENAPECQSPVESEDSDSSDQPNKSRLKAILDFPLSIVSSFFFGTSGAALISLICYALLLVSIVVVSQEKRIDTLAERIVPTLSQEIIKEVLHPRVLYLSQEDETKLDIYNFEKRNLYLNGEYDKIDDVKNPFEPMPISRIILLEDGGKTSSEWYVLGTPTQFDANSIFFFGAPVSSQSEKNFLEKMNPFELNIKGSDKKERIPDEFEYIEWTEGFKYTTIPTLKPPKMEP